MLEHDRTFNSKEIVPMRQETGKIVIWEMKTILCKIGTNPQKNKLSTNEILSAHEVYLNIE